MSENHVKANEQEIRYLTIVFGILLVADISLISWLFTTAEAWYMRAGGTVVVVLLSAILYLVHSDIKRFIQEIRRL